MSNDLIGGGFKGLFGLRDMLSGNTDQMLAKLKGIGELQQQVAQDKASQPAPQDISGVLGAGSTGGGSSGSSKRSSGGGRRSGGGGGGGGGGGAAVNQLVVDALQQQYADMLAGKTQIEQPYRNALSGINSAYDQAGQHINAAGAAFAQQLDAARANQTRYDQQLQQAYSNPGLQFDNAALMRDLQNSGAGTGGLQAQAAIMAQQHNDAAQARNTLAQTLVGAHQTAMDQRGLVGNQLTAGAQGALDINHLAYVNQNAKAQTAADQAYQQQLDQLRSTMAGQGVSPKA